MKSMDKNFTHHAMESGALRQTGKYFASVTGVNLAPLTDIFRYVCPLMHTIMGLGNSVFNELKRVVIELDSGDLVKNVEMEAEKKSELGNHV